MQKNGVPFEHLSNEYPGLYRGFNMSAHVFLNLLNELGKEIKCGVSSILFLFRNEFNKFNKARA